MYRFRQKLAVLMFLSKDGVEEKIQQVSGDNDYGGQEMKVSIIVPVYNVAPYIEACLRSVMRQTYQGEMECLLIDDCGTDDSMAIAKKMISAYEGLIFFKLISHERNRGLSAARNTGLDAASGEWIYFLDSDDTITDNCITLLMEEAEADDAVEMVQGTVKTSPVENLDKSTPHINVPKSMTNKEVRDCFYRNGQLIVAAWNKLIKRSLITKHNLRFIEGVIYEDTTWTFDLLKYLNCVSFVPEITYHYVRRANSIMTGMSNKAKADSFLKNYRYIVTHLTQNDEQEEVMYYAKKFSYFYARYSCYNAEYDELMQMWVNKVKTYCGMGLLLRLSLAKIAWRLKYGWVLMSILSRIEDPTLIPIDFKRIAYRQNCL